MTEFFFNNSVETLPWPPQSPDMNPIENLWAWMVKKLEERPLATSKADLKKQLLIVWDEIPLEMIRSLIMSLPRRLERVIVEKGKATVY